MKFFKNKNDVEALASPLTLPCGAILSNRICKAAMTEGLANPLNQATQAHVNVYDLWSQGGAGLLLTGNVQVDRRHLERAGNVAIAARQSAESFQALRDFARSATKNGVHIWMQISHAGRQTPFAINPSPKAPSSVQLHMPGAAFGKPSVLTDSEINQIIERFAFAAKTAREAGFTGVQLHAAHGYLVSQFLSPRVNLRSDKWGGSLSNRARLLRETLRAMRKATAPDFPIGVKLNSADFKTGGFEHDHAIQVAKWVEEDSVDLLEISGGTYESPVMMKMESFSKRKPDANERLQESTIAREAYFMKYAANIRKAVSLPLMLTGGFRRRDTLNEAIGSGVVDIAGIARPFCADPYAFRNLCNGVYQDAMPKYENILRLGPTSLLGANSPFRVIRGVDGFGKQSWFCMQILRMGEGKMPDLSMNILKAFRLYMKNETQAAEVLVF